MTILLLFLVLILSTLAVVCVGFAIYLRVRRHMKASVHETSPELRGEQQ